MNQRKWNMKLMFAGAMMSLAVLAAGVPPAAGQEASSKSQTIPAATEQSASADVKADGGEIRFQILNQAVGNIDRRLFGQFMERPSWGEIGVEAAVVEGTHDLQPAVLKLLDEMKIPIVRFPGGTDVDFMDWRDMVDNIPGRDPARPISTGNKGHKVTNRFGYDEFLRLADKLGWETIIVVNLRDAQLGLRPLKDAALHAAGLVAYCNALVGAKLPEGMPDWPALRAKNGHPMPYGVKNIQLGNETWAWWPAMKAAQGERYEEAYLDSIAAYEEAIHAVDPSVKIITDYNGQLASKLQRRMGDKIAYLCEHYYMPWTIKKIERDGLAVPAQSLTAQEIWYAWVTTPGIDSDGLATLRSNVFTAASGLGYKVAVTEWNWNGGWGRDAGKIALDSSFARALGAAGFVHALMRRGNVVEIATQSMLVGKSWGIAAILVDEKGVNPPRYTPSGMVTTLYGLHHGDKLMEMKAIGVPTYNQRICLEDIRPHLKVAMIDALATASDKAVYWHAINRSFDQAYDVTLDLSELSPAMGKGHLYVLEGRLEDGGPDAGPIAKVRQEEVAVQGPTVKIKLPARCVAVLEIGRQ